MHSIEYIRRDITRLDTDANIFPAHKHLIRGRGLSAQIYDIIGEPLVEACSLLGKCPIGEAKITQGFNLPTNYIIHTVTPLWSGGDLWGVSVMEQLRRCYENSLNLALDNGIKCLALASLGSGNNKMPHDIASRLGLEVLHKYTGKFDRIIMCLHSTSRKKIWLAAEQRYSLH